MILSGGSGERLWPASKPHRPKPFLSLVGEQTPFEAALARARALPAAELTTIVAGAGHETSLRQTLAGKPARLILEPCGRDTAPAMAAAGLVIAEQDAKAVLLFMPADHFVPDVGAFADCVASMAHSARGGSIATMGLTPTKASSAYGYLLPEPGPAQEPSGVAAFVEKPDGPLAATLIAEGALWNAGVFAIRADVLIGALRREAPTVLNAAMRAVDGALREHDAVRLGDAFADAPRISFDVAVLEQTDLAVVHPAALAWSDLGGWPAVLAASERDADGNSAAGAVVLQSAFNCVVRAGEGKRVAVVGASNLAVIVDDDGVMICDLDAADQVRIAVDRVSGERR